MTQKKKNPTIFEMDHARTQSNSVTWMNFQQEVAQRRDTALSEARRSMSLSHEARTEDNANGDEKST